MHRSFPSSLGSISVKISPVCASTIGLGGESPAREIQTPGEWIRDFLSQYTASLSYTSSDITVSGDWAIERFAGTLTLTPVGGGDPMEEPLKGIHVYRRGDDGSWKMVYDVWNSDTPLPEM